MKYIATIWLLLVVAASAPAQGVLSPTAPTANQGQSITITCASNCGTGGAWTLPGGAGTLSGATATSVTYTAPATITPASSYGGYQLFPNNHIYNTRVDALPLCTVPTCGATSATLIAGAGIVPFTMNQQPAWQLNYVDNTTPTQNMLFAYTAANNGPFPIPAFPGVKIESGWLTIRGNGFDHHLFTLNTATGKFSEMYQYGPAGQFTNCCGCPTCTSLSGILYSPSSYGLPSSQGGGVDAAGLYVIPLQLRLQEMEQAITLGIPIKHAIRITMGNASLHPAFLWPGTAFANAGSGANFYGEHLRLKASFAIGGFSSIAQIILTAMKNYGLIIADGGTNLATQIENVNWPANIAAAFAEIDAAAIAPSNFEVPDVTGLMVTANSGNTTANRELVTYTSSTGTATVDVAVVGAAVGFKNDLANIQAGTPAQQLVYYASGGQTNTVTCTMSPTVGTLTAGCLFTPPASVSSSGATTTITATSVDNSAVAAQMTVAVLPTPGIYLRVGATANFTDSGGHVWIPGGCDTKKSIADLSAGGWPGVADIAVYYFRDNPTNDTHCDFSLLPGNYQVTLKQGADFFTEIDSIDVQGVPIYTNVTVQATAQGLYKPLDLPVNTTVGANGLLTIGIRQASNLVPGNVGAILTAIQIVPGGPGQQSQVPLGHIP